MESSTEQRNPALHEFSTYQDFFPFYVGQHSKPATRWFHFVGTHLGAALGITGMATRRPPLLAVAPVVAYGLAWFSHFAIEGNKPASFGHPLWSVRGDFQMLAMMWQGRDAELTRIAEDSKRLTVREGAAAA
ncbi:MAG: Mpo1-like protein [Candidatus Dormibacteria bacterium]